MSKQTRRDLREANRDYKEAKSELKSRKRSYQKAQKREKRLLKPNTDAEKRYVRQKQKARHQVAKKDLKPLKERKKATKVRKRQAIQRNGGTKIQKVGRASHHQASYFVDSAFQDNDTLEDVARARQTIRRTHVKVRQTKKVGRYATKLGKRATGNVYGVGNRTYNLVRGRGFTRTPTADRWETKVKNKYQRLRARMRTSKVGKSAHTAKQVASKVSKPIVTVLKNPLSAKSYLIMFLAVALIAILGAVFGGGTTISQNEFDLTESWNYISKLDREKSNDKVDYYTDIDSILLYMNYRYGGKWKPSAKWEDGTGGKLAAHLGFNHFSNALDDIWQEENGDMNNLKTMAELYTHGKEWMKLSKKELEEYKEILEAQSETGKYATLRELENPFYPLTDSQSETATISITKRYGYTSKDSFNPTASFQADKGQKLYAPLAGKVTVGKKDLLGKKASTTNIIISTADARFILYDVGAIRVKTGATITEGTELGTVNGSVQKVAYAKRFGKLKDKTSQWIKDIRDKKVTYGYLKTKGQKTEAWVLVNPGFYFPFVSYAQSTIVTQEISSEMSGRAKQLYDYIKKYKPKAKDNGIAAMSGCFGVESSINPKRAEGDYLSPPVGASGNSWDDENWLMMGGPAIYGGGYPNILHRGLGLGQWTDTTDGANRNTLLRAFAKKKGKKWYDLELQIQFMLEGDNPYYIHILNTILESNDSVEKLTADFLARWEGVPGNKLVARQAIARQALSWFHQPNVAGGGSLASSFDFPESYRSKVKRLPTAKALTTQPGSGYPVGQCTWYAYNRLVELGEITDLSGAYGYLGNGGDWVRSLIAKGWKSSPVPQVGAVMSTAGGFDWSMAGYGHVSIVEAVNSDGSFLISECNVRGILDKVHWRVCRPAAYYSWAVPK